jgi:hypothetical protein
MEAGTANVRGMFLHGSESVGLTAVGILAYTMMQGFLFYNLNDHPEFNPETKEIYFFYLTCEKGTSGRTPTPTLQSSNPKN